jgi:cysteine desulfurase
MQIYLDSAATTVVFDEIKDNLPYILEEFYANPNSIHSAGQKVKNKIESSRLKIAEILGCKADNIVFTSCATESNNTVFKSLIFNNKSKDEILISPIEHKSVLVPAKFLSKFGFKIKFLKIDKNGKVDLDDLKSKITEKTAIVSVVHANNETGVLQDIEEIGKICKEKNSLFFTDTVQSFLKENIPVDYVDFLSVSGHKINALKGVGILYAKNFDNITPLLHGGGQENAVRSGTQNVPGIISLEIASTIWNENKITFCEKIKKLRDLFENKLKEKIPDIEIVSEKEKRVCHISNVIFPKVDAQSMLLSLSSHGVYVSSGSACSSGTPTPSHVLLSYGYKEEEVLRSLRFSFSIYNTEEEIEQAIKTIVNVFNKLYSFV